MQIDKRSRAELKQYFVKNAIPTESNFAELIDGMLSQRDDGIAKLPNDALSIEAAGDDTSQKKAIQFYGSFNDANPTWMLSLNPRQDPANAATARPGFSISDSAGISRLFIERGSGNLGVGTIGPLRAALHIDRGATNNLALMLSSSGPGWGSGLQLENTAAGASKTFGIYTGSGALHFADVNLSVDRMVITKDGDVGVGTYPSGAKLQVAGTVKANRFMSDNTLALNDYTTPNPSSNVYLYSPLNDRDAWIYLDSAGTSSNWGIYHHQVDTTVKGLPANSIAFVGGGQSKLQAYISLGDGSAFFAGNASITGNLTVAAGVQANGKLSAVGNAGVLDIEGTDHAYIQWYPMKAAAGRKGWIGYGGPNTTTMSITNDAGELSLSGDGVRVNGAVTAPAGALLNAIGVGTQTYGKTTWPYETIQMNPANNLRVWFGTTERFIFLSNGTFSTGTANVTNSDIYFMGTEHNHSGIGNTAGYAAIENAKDYDALMILGRAGTSVGRKVRLWDYLKVEGTLANLSDATTKRDIVSLEYGLAEVKKLRPIAFNWIDRPNPHKSLGLVGQEVREVLKEVVYDDDGQISISYLNLIPVLINAIKDLDKKIEALSP